mmetsp:Transcript_2611/g.4090  ORF Transcript_2611/g.4090 Transcript_2611/m.4090 type:complete len:181 (+) Transcript_2611:24-566(+)
MLKKPEEIRTSTQLRSSNIRGLKANLVEKYPPLEPHIDNILPKRSPVMEAKFKAPHNHLSFIYSDSEILFVQDKNHIIPHLRVLHKYPFILKKMQIDRGGIKHVVGGANVMSPGLTSAGGHMEEAEAGEIVAIVAEGKQHALGIGVMLMSTQQIREENKGIAIETLTYLLDGLWNCTPPS